MSKKSSKKSFDELRMLLLGYFRQEIIRPIKRIATWALLGILGSFFVGIGLIFVLVGGIRVLQNETGDVFGGSFSWAPYLLALAGFLLLLAFGAKTIGRKRNK